MYMRQYVMGATARAGDALCENAAGCLVPRYGDKWAFCVAMTDLKFGDYVLVTRDGRVLGPPSPNSPIEPDAPADPA